MTTGNKKKIFLIDGHAFIYRSFFAERTLATSAGLPTNAIYGFINSLLHVFESQKVEYVVVALDSGRPTFRNELFPDYKANRPEAPEDLVAQIPHILRFLDAMNIDSLALDGFEADDILGTLALRAKQSGFDVVVVTSDKDAFQLVNDAVVVFDPWKDVTYNSQGVRDKLGVAPAQVRDFLALAGDSSDNIPGVPSVGPKTAAALLSRFGSVEAMLSAPPESAEDKGLKKVLENKDLAKMSLALVTIRTDAPVELDPADCQRKPPDQESLLKLLQALEFTSLANRLLSRTETVRKDYRAVLTREQLDDLRQELLAADELAVDTETTGTDAISCQMIGISFATRPDSGWYIPFAHSYIGAPRQLERSIVLSALKPILEDASKRKVGQNIKFDLLVLRNQGIELRGISFDTMIADYLLRPTQPGHGLDAMSLHYLGYQKISYKELVPPRSSISDLRDVEVSKVADYASEDADVALILKRELEPPLAAQGLRSLFHEIEMPLVSVLADMEHRGVKLNVAFLGAMSNELKDELNALEDKIFHLAGEEFNINSPRQLSHILFEQLKLPRGRKTKTEYSTDVKVLQSLARVHPLPAELLAYRELSKLKSTYVDALPKLVNPQTGRIHTSFNQTITATGRLSSSEPNLQNIPIRTEVGRKIRQAFIPEDGHVLASFDYSQIELRLLAHLSADAELVAAFKQGKDVHARTAANLFGVPEALVTVEQRGQAKTINFGVIYGMGPLRLAQDLGISMSTAKQYIAEYFARYSGVKELTEKTYKKAASDGYVSTMFGRRRGTPDIQSSDRQKSEAAKRAAFNTIVQGSAADIIKIVMIKVAEAIKARRLAAHMILQVHDELVFEVRQEQTEEAIELIRPIMEGSVKLNVPLVTSVVVGKNWKDAK
ncbi:MAG: DNA polymerase I [Candidatus Coatesbacteria bacterium]|nr:DNA polymerase I [Candidatus Coatesbacteria bacterium]